MKHALSLAADCPRAKTPLNVTTEFSEAFMDLSPEVQSCMEKSLVDLRQ